MPSAFPIAFMYSVLTELSYTSIEDPRLFLRKLSIRLAVSLVLFMIAGLGIGHLMWTYHEYETEVQEHHPMYNDNNY